MREIKFRGKRVDNGEWAFGYYFESFTGIPYILQLHDHILKVTQYTEVISGTVGQYTGLKDKNGKEIYEGDVARHKQFINYGVLDLLVGVVCINPYNGIMVGMDSIGGDVEVLGNIHDNPELLREGEE